MGLDINAVQFLTAARNNGVNFSKTVMLGRQSLNVFPKTMVSFLERNGISSEQFKTGTDCVYAEPFFKALGAIEIDSLDNSAFEGARLVHDLNVPIPSDWKKKFNVVFDGGTLEHIFNFPIALRNSMELLCEGGHLFIHTCVNNLCGHGFYQFSPELFYRALSVANGFEVERMVVHRVGPYGSWYEVADPHQIRSRVELITFTPMQLLIQAKRVRCKAIFEQPPQQSDYTALWQSLEKEGSKSSIKKAWPAGLARLLHVAKTGVEFYRRQSLSNRRFFRKVRRF